MARRVRHHHPLQVFGLLAMVFVIVSIFTSDTPPGLEGERLAVTAALIAFVAGLLLTLPWGDLPDEPRVLALILIGAASVALAGLQDDSGGYAGIYFVVVVASARLPLRLALAISGLTLAAEIAVFAVVREDSAAHITGLLFSVVPWFFVMRLLRELGAGRQRAEALVEELRESRGAVAESAAMAERGRVARDMHDVLAHTLSALSLQLEGTRLMARDRAADPEVVEALERAHHLAAGGLAEARDAIGALRGDAMPGPERLRELTEAFAGDARLVVEGEPRALDSEARLALYRTAQEALTNVTRHSAADRVEIRLAYGAGGTRLVIQDFGPGAPVAVGAGPGDGGSPPGRTPDGTWPSGPAFRGYGLTGMRERAELLGGELTAGPTDDGFRVELWLPEA